MEMAKRLNEELASQQHQQQRHQLQQHQQQQQSQQQYEQYPQQQLRPISPDIRAVSPDIEPRARSYEQRGSNTANHDKEAGMYGSWVRWMEQQTGSSSFVSQSNCLSQLCSLALLLAPAPARARALFLSQPLSICVSRSLPLVLYIKFPFQFQRSFDLSFLSYQQVFPIQIFQLALFLVICCCNTFAQDIFMLPDLRIYKIYIYLLYIFLFSIYVCQSLIPMKNLVFHFFYIILIC